jgi:GMP synthase (glutamine-hydrolysing)
MKTALIIRHVPYEGVAGYRDPIEAAGYQVDRIDVCDPAFSRVDLVTPDLVIMMGGPMGVYEADSNAGWRAGSMQTGQRWACVSVRR